MTKKKPIKTKVALVSKFTVVIGVSVFLTVLFISAYNLYASTPIIEQYKIYENRKFVSVSNLLRDSINSELKKGTDTGQTYRLAKSLSKNDLILYAGLVKNENQKYIWSTVENLSGTNANINNVWKDGNFSEKFSNMNPANIRQINFKLKDKLLFVSFYSESSLVDLVGLMIKGNMTLSVVFIIFGFWSAFILAKYVTQPIKKLVDGAEEFAGGNLKYRTDVKTEDEIGILANAFNSMAEKLSELYNSLEQKVMDRTHELSKKNLQIKRAYKDLKDTQAMVVHNEKMRSLGQLVAGVAHELNNPINFIYGNLAHLKNYTNDLLEIIGKYEKIQKQFPQEKFEEVENLKNEIDYEFLTEDIFALLKSCTDGAERSKQIIIDLKNFSRLDEALIKEVDIHEGIDSALNILKNKFKDTVTVHKDYGELPKINCYAGQVNQVFMNVIDNAAQAINETGDIYIRTKLKNNTAIIEIEDTGPGIPEDILPKIFDPFFTTKPVGEGTGLGLSICYKIIKSHNGKMEAVSEKGKGTKFIITLPVNWSEEKEENEPLGEESINA